MLTSLVDPSAVIRKEYLNYTVRTTDGRVLNGFVAAESAGSIVLGSATGERTEIARDRIASMEDSGVSLMPEGLLNALTTAATAGSVRVAAIGRVGGNEVRVCPSLGFHRRSQRTRRYSRNLCALCVLL
jgi:hypothetical protein